VRVITSRCGETYWWSEAIRALRGDPICWSGALTEIRHEKKHTQGGVLPAKGLNAPWRLRIDVRELAAIITLAIPRSRTTQAITPD